MTQDKEITIQDVIARKKAVTKRADAKLILRAYYFAKTQHKDQKRRSGEPYIIHPLNVAYILADVGLDDATICAALLHDVVEDTEITHEDLVKEFGSEIAEMVAGVTKLSTMPFDSIEEQQVEDYRKMFLAMGKDIRVIIIKLADRLHNMRTLKYLKRERQIANAKETMEIYAPLANRLGLYSLKWELEDLSFKYLYPEEYHELVEGINKKRDERLKFIEKIMNDIRAQLKKSRVNAEVTGRAKHLYSIYRKMKRDNKTLDQIYDLFALRILVNSVKDCYVALGIVHEMYSPMPGRFKDYISVPKPNMYQSIHTTLLGEKGTPFEVQIRTWEMHKIAEYGIAAHWAYKEANFMGKGKQNVKVEDDKLAWLRESLEWQRDMQDPQEFLETLKTELFEDEVYVFTPRGEIKTLPRGATSIDFAYAIHAEIGHHMTGCKINSKMMPILTPLNNGDIVEIITSDNSKGPSRDWLKFVKSTSAKNKIQQWFKKTEKAQNIEKGKDLIEKEVKRIRIPHAELFKDNYIKSMLERYGYKNIDEMYAAVGFGGMSPVKIIARMLMEDRKEHQEDSIEEKIEELSKERQIKPKPSSSGIVVKGIDNCLVRIAKCCNPLPGDEIVGYITKTNGITVHRISCHNLDMLEDRTLNVQWSTNVNKRYLTYLLIYTNDSENRMLDLVQTISMPSVNVDGVKIVNKGDKIIYEVACYVTGLEQLNRLIMTVSKNTYIDKVEREIR